MPPCTCILIGVVFKKKNHTKSHQKSTKKTKTTTKSPATTKAWCLWSELKPITRAVVSGASSGGTGSGGQPDNCHGGRAVIAVPGARLLLISPVPKVPLSRPIQHSPSVPSASLCYLQLHMSQAVPGESPGLLTGG